LQYICVSQWPFIEHIRHKKRQTLQDIVVVATAQPQQQQRRAQQWRKKGYTGVGLFVDGGGSPLK
jgi:hypothetical protein